MAHFAQLDENNVVLDVIVIDNSVIIDPEGNESEALGIAFCQSLYGDNTNWRQTSYNANFRKQYACIGYSYLVSGDVFIKPKPPSNPSFILDDNYDWVPPIPRPTDTVYKWDEGSVSWLQVPQPYPSWTAQGDPLVWTAPIPYPTDYYHVYKWDEATLSWVLID